ncbi:MAG TPA: sigma-70 family RNA polymerase sigma factor, partial [Herpetosiphonaceae bacterium]|nr:sigma-70 family RNA polymerase sigma factor [Herpetosiphonaceae bacterium]
YEEMAMQPSDETLVQACRDGDPDAWEALIKRYQALVYSIPIRGGLQSDVATEVFQGVFAMLVEKLDDIQEPSRIGAWLVTTARRETWRLARRERAERLSTEAATEDEVGEVPDRDILPEEQLLRMETQHLVRTGMAALDERCRTLLTLLFYRPEPPSYAEIAAMLGTSEGSIGPARIRCLQKLRRILEDAGL